LVLLLVSAALTGCGPAKKNNGIATVTGTSSAAPSATPSKLSNAEAGHLFAQCMRDHGVQMQDPEVGDGGEFRVQIGGAPGDGGTPPDRSKVDAAMKECQKYMPGGGEMRKPSPEDIEKLREMAECMRANGVPNFPDPDPNGGGLMIDGNKMGDQETFKKAMDKCAQYGPKGGPGGGSLTTQDGPK
jgi:hypothetical protein